MASNSGTVVRFDWEIDDYRCCSPKFVIGDCECQLRSNPIRKCENETGLYSLTLKNLSINTPAIVYYQLIGKEQNHHLRIKNKVWIHSPDLVDRITTTLLSIPCTLCCCLAMDSSSFVETTGRSSVTDLKLTSYRKDSRSLEACPTTLLKTLSDDLSSCYERKSDSDCVLRVGDARFPVHRIMLSARSTVFRAMFRHDTMESRSGEVNITDVKSTILYDVLFYIYSGKIRGLSVDTATAMVTAADKYALLELKETCLNYLMRNLNFENICDAILLAQVHAEDDLEEKSAQFVKENLKGIMENDTWKTINDDYPRLTLRIMYRALFANKDIST